MWDAKAELSSIWEAALAAADPRSMPPTFWPKRPKGRLVVVAAGKAAARMAEAAEAHYGAPLEGLAVTVYGYEQPTQFLRVVSAGHPVPDEAGYAAAEEILALAQSLRWNDLLLVLLSGGASALLPLPAQGVSLADIQETTRALLASGAPISAMNAVRKHMSRLNGGRLAAAAFPARTVTLAISDVPRDRPSVIASGPTVADGTTLANARAALLRHKIAVPASVEAALQDRANESVKALSPKLWRSRYHLVARPRDALRAAAGCAASLGYEVADLGDRLEGEARDVAGEHVALVVRALAAGKKVAIVSGGELSVTGATGRTSGGRCREYALAFAVALGARAPMSRCSPPTPTASTARRMRRAASFSPAISKPASPRGATPATSSSTTAPANISRISAPRSLPGRPAPMSATSA